MPIEHLRLDASIPFSPENLNALRGFVRPPTRAMERAIMRRASALSCRKPPTKTTRGRQPACEAYALASTTLACGREPRPRGRGRGASERRGQRGPPAGR